MKPTDELEMMFAETGELDEVHALAAKKILTADIRLMMAESKVSNTQLAREMHTASLVVDRLLDPNNASVTLKTIAKAAAVLGGQIRVQV
jgi:DNA-binding Xre family transcriptional regulator